MHEAALAIAARPAPVVVLGMLLRPYSLGHELCLIRENNPLHEADKATPGQLREAVWICCQSWTELVRYDRLLNLKMWIWDRRIRRLNHKHPRGGNHHERHGRKHELSKFVAYRNLGIQEFPLSDPLDTSAPETSSRVLGAPFVLRLQQFMMLKFGLGEAAAWDYPYGLAKMRMATFCEEEAGIKIYNRDDAAHDAYVMEQEAAGKELLKHG